MDCSMKIIQVHNYYKQTGGEDVVVKAELELLQSKGNTVVTYYKNNEDICGLVSKVQTAFKTLWNHAVYKEFVKLLQDERPDVVHCHNAFPLISPSIYWACSKENIPIVQTIHNYRLLCLNALLLLKDKSDKYNICERCVKKSFKFPGIINRCYKNSFFGSLVLAKMLYIHKLIGTWNNKIDKYVVLTDFQKEKFIKAGLPNEKITVKPHFIKVLEAEKSFDDNYGDYAVYVGRLSKEKGCDIAIKAWKLLKEKSDSDLIKLLIVGDGEEKENLEKLADNLGIQSSVLFLGKQPYTKVLSLLQNSKCLIMPSICYESFGLTIIEAFSCGCPVIASDSGNTASIIDNNQNGLLFSMGNHQDLYTKLNTLLTNNELSKRISTNAKKSFEQKYCEDTNYEQLIKIYDSAIESKKNGKSY